MRTNWLYLRYPRHNFRLAKYRFKRWNRRRKLSPEQRALEDFLNLELMRGLREEEDQQILYGDGTGEELRGIIGDSE